MSASTILAIDLSTARGEIAVVRQSEVRFEAAFTAQRSHNAQLFAPLAEALASAGDQLDLIVVGTGPGSYTGVRIAIAAAHGIALSRQVPVIGLPSICAPSTGLQNYRVIGDARRGMFYIARVRGARLDGTIELHQGEATRQQVSDADSESWLTFDATVPMALAGVIPTHPSASRLAVLAGGLAEDEVARLSSATLEPVYLQDPFITTSKRAGKMPAL